MERGGSKNIFITPPNILESNGIVFFHNDDQLLHHFLYPTTKQFLGVRGWGYKNISIPHQNLKKYNTLLIE